MNQQPASDQLLGGVKRKQPEAETGERFYCPFPGCQRSFAELWRLKVHYRAAPDVRGSGKERGHGMELDHCPRCNQELKPGKHHVGCIGSLANRARQQEAVAAQAVKKQHIEAPASTYVDINLAAGAAPYYPPVETATVFKQHQPAPRMHSEVAHGTFQGPRGVPSRRPQADAPVPYGAVGGVAPMVDLMGVARPTPRHGWGQPGQGSGHLTAPNPYPQSRVAAPEARRSGETRPNTHLPDLTRSEISDDVLLPTLPELLQQEEAFHLAQIRERALRAQAQSQSAKIKAQPATPVVADKEPQVENKPASTAASASNNNGQSNRRSEGADQASPVLAHLLSDKSLFPFGDLDLTELFDPIVLEDPTELYGRYAEPIHGADADKIAVRKPQTFDIMDIISLMPCE